MHPRNDGGTKRHSWSVILAVLIAAIIGASPWAMAQDSSVAEKVQAKKQADLEMQKAAKASLVNKYAADTFQGQIAELARKRLELDKAVAFSEVRLSFAKKQLEQATAAKDAESTKRYQDEVNTWGARLTTAKTDLVQSKAEYDALVAAYKKSLAAAQADDIILQGETIELFVAEDETFNGPYEVRRGGDIILPRIGRVMVAGKTVPETEKLIKTILEETQLKTATVIVERSQTNAPEAAEVVTQDIVYLAGASGRSGYWTVPEGVHPTLMIALLRTGGMADANSDLRHVKVLRLVNGKGYVEEVNVDAILGGRQLLTSDLSLVNNDIVVVPKLPRQDYFYITGNVAQQGMQQIPREEILTTYAGILRAGGFARFANENKVYVLRWVGSGQRVRIPVQICQVKKGLLPDLILDDQDIVVVPEKFFSF